MSAQKLIMWFHSLFVGVKKFKNLETSTFWVGHMDTLFTQNVFWKGSCLSQWQGLGGHFMACKDGDVTRVVCVFTAGSRLGKKNWV